VSVTLVPAVFPALGTTAAVAVSDPAAMPTALAAVQGEIGAVDAACSRFRSDSELSAVNRAAGRPVTVSALFIEAVDVALRAAELTGGRVVPTVGAAMRVLGYDRDFATVARTGPASRVTVGPVPGWRLVRVDRTASTINIPAGVELDLGATAKAWCADLAAATAAECTGAGVLVSLGGDVAIAGPAPEGGWTVRVADSHAAPADRPGQTVSVRSGGLATSGTTVRCWQRGDVALHHILDPSTGRPAATSWVTVTVAAGSCAEANIAATAAIILGAQASAWLEARHLPARLVDDDGAVTVVGCWPSPDERGPWS